MQAVIFDFDGLILDTEWPEVQSWQEIFLEFGQDLPDAWWKGNIGRGADQDHEHPLDVLERQLGHLVDRFAIDAKQKQKRLDLIAAEIPLPGVIARIHEAKEQGFKLAVASSSGHSWVDGNLERLNLRQYFELTVCRDDVAMTKPSPELYVQAVAKLNLSPTDAFALEDSPTGALAAHRAGLKVVIVPNRLTAQMDLSIGDIILPSLADNSLAEIAAMLK